LILFVLTFVIEEVGTPEPALGSLVVVLSLAGLWTARWTARRELDLSNEGALAATYRAHFFLGFALNEAALLCAFALTFVVGEMWPYLLAFPFYLVGMWLIAPSKANLRRRQEQVTSQGSTMSVTRALASLKTEADA
jgi:hypothetical protein